MTLIFELGLDIMNVYQYTKNEVSSSRCSKLIDQKIIYDLTFDLDLDSNTLILKHDLDIMKIYHHAKNEDPSSRGSKAMATETFDLYL